MGPCFSPGDFVGLKTFEGLSCCPTNVSQKCYQKQTFPKTKVPKNVTLPETNSSHLKIGLPNRKVVFQPSIFRGENVSFRECTKKCCGLKIITTISAPTGGSKDQLPLAPSSKGAFTSRNGRVVWFHILCIMIYRGDYQLITVAQRSCIQDMVKGTWTSPTRSK